MLEYTIPKLSGDNYNTSYRLVSTNGKTSLKKVINGELTIDYSNMEKPALEKRLTNLYMSGNYSNKTPKEAIEESLKREQTRIQGNNRLKTYDHAMNIDDVDINSIPSESHFKLEDYVVGYSAKPNDRNRIKLEPITLKDLIEESYCIKLPTLPLEDNKLFAYEIILNVLHQKFIDNTSLIDKCISNKKLSASNAINYLLKRESIRNSINIITNYLESELENSNQQEKKENHEMHKALLIKQAEKNDSAHYKIRRGKDLRAIVRTGATDNIIPKKTEKSIVQAMHERQKTVKTYQFDRSILPGTHKK